MMYSQDGMGLGHLRRSFNIAQEALLRDPGLNVLIVADSPASSMCATHPNIECLKLPTVVKTGAAEWRNGTLSVPVERVLKLRARVLLDAFREFRPDAVLVDHMPLGALGELRALLDHAIRMEHPPKLFLGLRDIVDAPAVVRRVWGRLGAYAYLPHYDAVLVYGSREIFDAASAYALAPAAREVVYCNYVTRADGEDGATAPAARPYLLAMGGGGRDAFPVAQAFARAVPALQRELRLRGVLLTGPNMLPADRRRLAAEGGPSLDIRSALEDSRAWIAGATALVTMGGYNSLGEVLRWRRKAVVVPRRGPSLEQRMRTRLFADRGLVVALDPDELDATSLSHRLRQLVHDDGVPSARNMPTLDGGARAADVLIDALADRPRSAARRPRRLQPAVRHGGGNGRTRPDAGAPAVEGAGHDGLPSLPFALDCDAMTALIRSATAATVRDAEELTVRSARIIAGKEGQRALIEYGLDGRNGHHPPRVFGKLFADPARAERLHRLLVFLAHEVFGSSPRLGVPEPLGWLPDGPMVLYAPAEGPALDEAMLADPVDESLSLVAEWVRALQRSSPPLDRRFDVEHEMTDVDAWARIVGDRSPAEWPAVSAIVERLRACHRDIDLETDVPIHKDLHHGHVLRGRKLSVVDFDEMRLGDRSFDPAHFCTHLHLLSVRAGDPPERLGALERAFLRAYATGNGWKPDERFDFFSAYTSVKVAKQLTTGTGVEPRPVGGERRRQLRAVLQRGLMLTCKLV
jgi:predicted glycosyltransferase